MNECKEINRQSQLASPNTQPSFEFLHNVKKIFIFAPLINISYLQN